MDERFKAPDSLRARGYQELERRLGRERENKRNMWQPGGGGKNKKCHLSKNAEVVPVSEPPKKVVPVFESGKRSCQYLIITLKVVPLYDVNPCFIMNLLT